MVFESSDIPLEEDIFKQKVDFVNTWTEWNADNSLILAKEQSSTGLQVTIYEVTKGNTFYLYYINLSHACLGGGTATAGNVSIALDNSGFGSIFRILSLSFLNDTKSGENQAVSFKMPLKLQEGTKIILVGHGSGVSLAQIMGVLKPKKVS